MKFATSVTKPGRSGLTNAYTSVLSTAGSAAISGASRWLDAPASPGPRAATPAAKASPSAASAVPRGRAFGMRIVPPLDGTVLAWVRPGRIGGWVAVRFHSLTHPRRRLLRTHLGGVAAFTDALHVPARLTARSALRAIDPQQQVGQPAGP